MISTRIGRAALVIVVGTALSACTQSSLRINPDFGNAVHQDIAAQIADPDARYEGVIAPGSDGVRVGSAQKRYQSNQVIPPSAVTASGSASIGAADNGSGGGAGAGAGVGASTGMSQ